MAPKRKPVDDETAADPDKNARLETYEEEVERASVESIAEHPDGSAGPRARPLCSLISSCSSPNRANSLPFGAQRGKYSPFPCWRGANT